VKSAPAKNRLNKFPHVPDPDSLEQRFLSIAQTDPDVTHADILLCSEPPFFCLMFLKLRKPMFGYIGNPFGAYLLPGQAQETFYQVFHDSMAADKRNTFACISPPLSSMVYWHTGSRIPAIQPLGLYTRATYRPQHRQVLVTKQIFLQWDIVCMLNKFAVALDREEVAAGVVPRLRLYNGTRFVPIKHLKDKTWTNWARHLAAVVVPYEPQLMIFYELYSMGMPLLVAGSKLLPLLTRLGYANLEDFAFKRPGWQVPQQEMRYDWTENAHHWELQWWLSLSDVVQAPHLLHWNSVPELLAKLHHTDLEETSSKMRRITEIKLLTSIDFWRDAFFRALAS